jgi:outer membrane protein assembly factor BamB
MLLILAVLVQAVATLGALDLRWLVPLDAPPASPAAYDANTAYVPVRGGALVAVDLDRGLVRWRRDLATSIAPSSGDGLVFVATEGLVQALAPSSGATRWRTTLPGTLLTITWDNGWLLCSNATGDLAALRASDGELVWHTELGATLVGPPVAGLDRVYVPLDGGRVVSLDLATGVRSWERVLPGRVMGLHAVNSQLIVGTTGNAVFSLDLASGRQHWRWRVGADPAGPAASDDRHVYFAARDNVLRAVDVRSGNLRWTVDLPSRPVGGPQILPGAIVVPLSTSVAAFDPATGKQIGSIAAMGEISGAPHIRLHARPTGAHLVALARDGRMQGFAPRFEEAPARLEGLPGVAVVP